MTETGHQSAFLPRRATWFELFFDLVFVAGVARLTGKLAGDYSPANLAETAFLFIVLWWCWIGHTFFATRFDEDRTDQRLAGLATISVVVFIDYAVIDAFGAGAAVFAIGVGLFKALMAVNYAIAFARTKEPVAKIYTVILAAASLVWLVSSAAGGQAQVALWIVGLAIDVTSPFIVTRFTHSTPPHPEHLPERFGLFVIILFGESVASLVHALDHLPKMSALDIALVVLAMGVPFLFWWGYFENVKGVEERHVQSKADARKLQLWAYGHIPALLGTTVMASGGRLVIEHHHFNMVEGLMMSAATGAAMAGLVMIAKSGSRAGGAKWPYLAIAGLTAASGLAAPMIGGAGLLVVLVVLACLQTFVIGRFARRAG